MLIVFTAFLTTVTTNADKETECKPREQLVRTYNIFEGDSAVAPQFVKLFRCSGIQPHLKLEQYRCVSDKDETIKKKFNTFFGRHQVEVELVNETSCVERDVCGRNKTPIRCEFGFNFNPNICECVPENFDPHYKKGGENEKNGVSVAILVTALVVELVIILLVVLITIDALKCRRKKQGVLYQTRTLLQSVRNRTSTRLASLHIGSIASPNITKVDTTVTFGFEDNVFHNAPDNAKIMSVK